MSIKIPKGIIQDKCNLSNDEKIFSTDIKIDNTLPVGTFEEIPAKYGTSDAKITFSENVRPIKRMGYF